MFNNNNNVKIAMLKLSDQNKAILDFYFSSTGQSLYTLVSKELADVFIMDYDYPTAKDHLAKIKTKTKKPVVLLSIKEQTIPATIWLAKPLSAQALTETAEKLKQLLLEPEEKIEPEATIEPEETIEAPESETNTTLDEEVSATEDDLHKVAPNEEKPNIGLNRTLTQSDDEIESLDLLKNKANENKLEVRSIMAKATSLATSSIGFNESYHYDIENENESDDLTEAENKNEESVSESSDKNSELDISISDYPQSDKNLELAEIFVDGQRSKNEENDEAIDELEVETLLDSLMSDEDISAGFSEGIDEDNDDDLDEASVEVEVDTEDQDEVDESISLEAKVLEVDIEDKVVVDELPILDIEESETDDLEVDNTDALLKELNLETAFDLSATEETNFTDNKENSAQLLDESLSEISLEENTSTADENKTKNTLIEESFTIHDEFNSPSEDTFASTFEFNYKKTKDTDSDSLTNINKSLNTEFSEASNEFKGINLETSEQIKKEVADNLISLKQQYEETELSINALGIDALEIDSVAVDSDLDSLLKEVSEDVDFNIPMQEPETNITPSTINDEDVDVDFVLSDELEEAIIEVRESDDSDDDLQSLLNEVRDEANKKTNGVSLGLDADLNDSSQVHKYEKTNAEKRWTQLCGDLDAIKSQKEIPSISYNLSDHLLDVFLTQIKTGADSKQANRIKYRDLFIVLDHTRGKVYCDFSLTEDKFAAVSFLELNPDDLKIHELDYSEIKAYRLKAKHNPNRAHSFESFIWTSSLLTSKGRLQAGTEINKKVGLKAWPNLTRVELMPHAIQIAAVFSKQPGSLLEMPTWIDVEQRYVFAFYNAALALDMIEFDANKLKKATLAFSNKGVTEVKAERGFFGRLLKRLKS